MVGHPASGKDAAAKYLEAKGFRHISVGDFLRELMRQKNIPTDRSHIRSFVKAMRAEEGNGYPAEEIAETITGDTIISGFRNTAEVAIFRKRFSETFIMIAVDAPAEIRYARIKERKRIGDDISFERFKEEEDAERAEDSGSHEVDKVMAEADLKIENHGTKQELFAELDKLLKDL